MLDVHCQLLIVPSDSLENTIIKNYFVPASMINKTEIIEQTVNMFGLEINSIESKTFIKQGNKIIFKIVYFDGTIYNGIFQLFSTQ